MSDDVTPVVEEEETAAVAPEADMAEGDMAEKPKEEGEVAEENPVM